MSYRECNRTLLPRAAGKSDPGSLARGNLAADDARNRVSKRTFCNSRLPRLMVARRRNETAAWHGASVCHAKTQRDSPPRRALVLLAGRETVIATSGGRSSLLTRDYSINGSTFREREARRAIADFVLTVRGSLSFEFIARDCVPGHSRFRSVNSADVEILQFLRVC